jgi:TfoX/Sxy family transcriptional regulator of competence genes
MGMKWRKSPEALEQRFDAIVPRDARVDRRKMFGYPAAFVGGNLFMGLHQESLILRLSEEDRAEFLKLPGASLFEPMPGRPMREYVTVPATMLQHDAALARWIDRSLDYTTSVPAKGPSTKSAKSGAAATPRGMSAGAAAQAKRGGTKPRR